MNPPYPPIHSSPQTKGVPFSRKREKGQGDEGDNFTGSIFFFLLVVIVFSSCSIQNKVEPGSKIISLLPSLTETVCALGLSAELCGVSKYCIYPETVVARLPKMGDCINPDLEKILRMRPRVVLVGDMQTEAGNKLKGLGVPVVALPQSSIGDVLAGIDSLGRLFGQERRADSLCAALQSGLDSLRALAAGKPPRRVFFVVGRNPGTLSNLYTVNRKSFLSELLQIAGGVSIFADVEQTWCKVALEEVMRRNPQVILETSLMGNEGEGAEVWKTVPSIDAVRNNRIYTLTEDYLFTPGPRLLQTASTLSRLLLNPGEPTP